MKKPLLTLALLLFPSIAFAQCNGVFPANTLCGNLSASPQPPAAFSASTSIVGPGSSTIGDVATWANAAGSQLADTPQSQLVVPVHISAVTTTGSSHTFANSDCNAIVHRTNSGSVMTDVLPSTSIQANCVIFIQNSETSAFYGIQAAGAATLNGVTDGYTLLGPGQSLSIQSDGSSNYTTLYKPSRAKLGAGTTLSLFWTGGTCNNSNMPLVSSTPWCDPQQCFNYVQANMDIGNNKGGSGIVCQQLDSTSTESNSQGGASAALNAAGGLTGQNSVVGLTFQGNCTTPANTVWHPSTGSVAILDDASYIAFNCLTVQIGTNNAPVFVAQHQAFAVFVDKISVTGGALTGDIIRTQDGGRAIQFGTMTISGGSGGGVAAANLGSRVEIDGTIAFSSSPTLAYTYEASDSSAITAQGVTYTGTPTITNKYVLDNGAFLNTSGACSGVPGTGTSVDAFSNCH